MRKFGKLAVNFVAGIWAVQSGAITLTQGYTGWDGNGAQTGIVSRTGQPAMLRAVPNDNAAAQIELLSVSTNMLTRQLGGKFGLWVYVEMQPGYQPNGTPAGSINIDISTTTSGGNAMYFGFNTNQVREGWNFLKFVQRNPAAYLAGSAVPEYHPWGVSVSVFGTGADTDLVNGTVNRLRIITQNLSGATLYFDSIWTGFETQPQVVLGNDAGPGLLEYVLPIFKANSWIGYTAFPYRIWSSGSKTIPDLNSNLNPTGQALYDAGWDFCNHTANHIPNGALTSEAEIAYELETAKAWQLSLGRPRGVEFYASPQSSSSRLSEKVIKALGYQVQRHARKWNVSVTPFGVDNPHHIGAIDMGSAAAGGVAGVMGTGSANIAGWQTASKLARGLDVIEAYGDTLFPFWHGLTTLGDSGTGEDLTGDNLLLTRSAFEKFCEDLRAREQASRITVCKGMAGFWYGASA